MKHFIPRLNAILILSGAANDFRQFMIQIADCTK